MKAVEFLEKEYYYNLCTPSFRLLHILSHISPAYPFFHWGGAFYSTFRPGEKAQDCALALRVAYSLGL
jgi:hypothetical protein